MVETLEEPNLCMGLQKKKQNSNKQNPQNCEGFSHHPFLVPVSVHHFAGKVLLQDIKKQTPYSSENRCPPLEQAVEEMVADLEESVL